jgi:hypothetical protein
MLIGWDKKKFCISKMDHFSAIIFPLEEKLLQHILMERALQLSYLNMDKEL